MAVLALGSFGRDEGMEGTGKEDIKNLDYVPQLTCECD